MRNAIPFTTWLVWPLALIALTEAKAQSNISADHANAWGANIGWIHWRPSTADGAQIGEFICSGYAYGANIGWISLGNGRPSNGIYYQNASANDFGVNHDQKGHLWGLAYSANVGWINFETNGAPTIDLQTGRLTGSVYGANVGWINLGDADFSLKVDSISGGVDSDQDGIPDAWELLYAGNLTTFTAVSDTDGDGFTDLEEYLADTNPLDPNDNLRIVSLVPEPLGLISHLTWTSKPTRQYRVQTRSGFDAETPWINTQLTPQIGTGQLLSAGITNRTPSARSFFRIELIRPLAP